MSNLPSHLSPKDIQTIIEKELGNICFITLFSVDYANWAAALSRTEGIKIFDEIEAMFNDLENSIETIARTWPAGKSVIMCLTNVSKILHNWLSNFREWGQLVHDYSDDQIDVGDVQEKYRPFVLRNREYRAQLDNEFAETASRLADVNVDLQDIALQSKEKVNNSEVTQQARAKAQAIFDEVWQSGRISRDQAVIKLAGYMELSAYDMKIPTFEIGQCGLVLSWGKLIRFELGI
ncbi:MAG: hypothetical protein HZB19_07860 [Chloroflexi bacterium]|nr:hypothetical protein [Chloroflexota bacterium]